MYFHPPSLTKLGIRLPKRPDPERNVEKAMMILSAHHEKIDAAKVSVVYCIFSDNTEIFIIYKYCTLLYICMSIKRHHTV